MTVKKSRVGLLTLFFDLYLGGEAQTPLLVSQREFAGKLVSRISQFSEVVFPGVCMNRAQVDAAVHWFDCEEVDAIVVVFLTYAPSLYAMPALQRTSHPVILFDTQKLFEVTDQLHPVDTSENHGVHGIMDLANVLLRADRPFHMVVGYWDDKAVMAELQAWCDAARVCRQLRQSQVGILGFPMENMGDFGLDETAFMAQTGVHINHIPQQMVADLAAEAPEADIDAQMAFDREHFEIAPDVTVEQHEVSSRLEWALRKVMQQRDLIGFASHFFAVGDEATLDTLPFLAACKLLGEGYSFGGEGDVTSAVATSVMRMLVGEATFAEVFTMSFGDNTVLMSHMGEGNWRMAHPDYPIKLLSSPFGMTPLRVPPVLLCFTARPGPATLLSLTTVRDGRLRFIITEGEVPDMAPIPALTRVHFKFRPSQPLPEFLRRFSEAGGSHHQGLAYGHIGSSLVKLAKLMGVEYEVV